MLQGHWDNLASWTPTNWSLGLGVFLSGMPTPPLGLPRAGCGAGWSGFAEVGAELSCESQAFFVGGDVEGAGVVLEELVASGLRHR